MSTVRIIHLIRRCILAQSHRDWSKNYNIEDDFVQSMIKIMTQGTMEFIYIRAKARETVPPFRPFFNNNGLNLFGGVIFQTIDEHIRGIMCEIPRSPDDKLVLC